MALSSLNNPLWYYNGSSTSCSLRIGNGRMKDAQAWLTKGKSRNIAPSEADAGAATVSRIFYKYESRRIRENPAFVWMIGRDKQTVTRTDLELRAIEVNFQATFQDISDVSSDAPVSFDKFPAEFHEANLSAILFVDLESHSRSGRTPFQSFKVDFVRVHFPPPKICKRPTLLCSKIIHCGLAVEN
jgi:hypothetical protein